jgi:sugar phosphate isomerase/epimerase
MKISRRNFIYKSSLATAAIPLVGNVSLLGNGTQNELTSNLLFPDSRVAESFEFNVFSKALLWLEVNEMIGRVAEMGFDGIDLVVRPNGHILPERVEDDLPKAVETAKKAGISIKMLVTAINNPDDPVTERILRIASSLGIRNYRMNWLFYNDLKTIDENLSIAQDTLSKLAKLGEKYKISCDYQNHSGKYTPNSYFGASIWDLHQVLKNINSPWLGSQFDIMHTVVEGAYSWETDLRLIVPYIHSLALKDFRWSKNQVKWFTENVPVGEGMVDFRKFLGLVKKFNIKCPVSVHYEFPLGGAERGSKIVNMDKEEILSKMKQNLATLKRYFSEEGLL